MQRKKELEAPFTNSLTLSVIRNVETAKNILKDLQERKHSGPHVEITKESYKTLKILKSYEPKKWNNIPIPLQELTT